MCRHEVIVTKLCEPNPPFDNSSFTHTRQFSLALAQLMETQIKKSSFSSRRRPEFV